MKKKIIVISAWKNESEFKQLKVNVESNISEVSSFYYLLIAENPKKIEELPENKAVYYLSKKDFTLLGKIKTPELNELLMKKTEGVLVVAMETTSSLLKKILKHSKLMSVGIEKETLPEFDLSFSDSQLSGGKLFKQINNYLTKIQL